MALFHDRLYARLHGRARATPWIERFSDAMRIAVRASCGTALPSARSPAGDEELSDARHLDIVASTSAGGS